MSSIDYNEKIPNNVNLAEDAGTLFAGLVCDPCVLRKLPALARYTRQAYRELQALLP